jgi:hypothetical protein
MKHPKLLIAAGGVAAIIPAIHAVSHRRHPQNPVHCPPESLEEFMKNLNRATENDEDNGDLDVE